VRIVYGDFTSGVDLSTLRISVGGVERTSEFTITTTEATWTPASALPQGPLVLAAQIADRATNLGQASSTVTIDTVAPALAIEPADSALLADDTPAVRVTYTDVAPHAR
jgi:hypothetical protein